MNRHQKRAAEALKRREAPKEDAAAARILDVVRRYLARVPGYGVDVSPLFVIAAPALVCPPLFSELCERAYTEVEGVWVGFFVASEVARSIPRSDELQRALRETPPPNVLRVAAVLPGGSFRVWRTSWVRTDEELRSVENWIAAMSAVSAPGGQA